MSEFIKVASKSEIPNDTGKLVQAGGVDVALFKNKEGQVCAIHSICPHQGGPLNEGGITENVVTCPWHGWEFDVTTGQCTFNPSIKIPVFKVKEENGGISVAV